ncbi:alpha/beta fold hydrolase [Ochrobactrum sp. Marseille-Q0166]|uniref:alpha/beta hydrolase family protein n=1 Tax=Ochrobactrum sp. Marseille-Q0166 TaxID=2761105 RepID=UPI001655FBBA|nr:alpha/beta fold hydrolase [Ochrobactrum sp. Marseille-Q0166]MBC8719947.1 alpha/beta fold hydrolase [Ochrobactrum sp. Marseille-Q0166]
MRDTQTHKKISVRPVEISAGDGILLGGHLWRDCERETVGIVIINSATGVQARYYHRYARFLAGYGFTVLTYDYRGIGLSRPEQMRGCAYRWRDWGELDFEAAIQFVRREIGADRLFVVGHSIGGFLPGLAPSGHHISRMLTVGAQYAWWGDYAAGQRLRLFFKWHVVMPVLTLACGYFPGRRMGWLEDLPAGVAHEWSFRRSSFERNHPVAERERALERMAAMTASILAVTISDDELGTPAAIRRTLDYYTHAERTAVLLRPSDYGRDAIGHFGLFHDSHAAGFWLDTLIWLRDGRNPWPAFIIDL